MHSLPSLSSLLTSRRSLSGFLGMIAAAITMPASVRAAEGGAPIATNLPPSVRFISPTNGAVFPAPLNLTLRALAEDSDGQVKQVEYFLGDRSLGRVTNAPYLLPVTNLGPGAYTFHARATDDRNLSSTLVTATIKVIAPSNRPPTVRLASPANGAIFAAPARIGVVAQASDEDGYVRTVQFFANEQSLGIRTNNPMIVGPANPFELVWSNAPAGTYTLRAKATDNAGAPAYSDPVQITVVKTTAPASLIITTPADGASFPANSDIPIEATATDPNGYISRVEFFSGTERIGVSEITFIRAPDPGTPIHHSFLWLRVPPGRYSLGATAVDTLKRTVNSPRITISVSGTNPVPTSSFIRDLPPAYSPGIKFLVTIKAYPAASGHAYAVEDRPPSGWTVSAISNDGVFDPATGKVKFGPFFDVTPRSLTYQLLPPSEARGKQEFSGSASVDGSETSITGDRVIDNSPRHPADLNPANNAISISELTAYAAAWRTGQRWSVEPNPIPISYVTRAGLLWKLGEAYTYDPAAGALPLAWVPLTRPGPLLARVVTSPGSAVRKIVPGPAGSTASISVTVNPSPGNSSYALEEDLPPGFLPTAISDGGRFDAQNHAIKWGPFYDSQPRVLRYQTGGGLITLPVRGTLSIDGSDKPVLPQPASVVSPK